MARLDPLLSAMMQHKMDALSLEPGSLPRLHVGDSSHEVTRSPLDEEAIEALLGEIAPDGEVPDAPGGTFLYTMGANSFEVSVAGGTGGRRVRVTPAPPSPAPGEEADASEESFADLGDEKEWEEEDLGDPALDEHPTHVVAADPPRAAGTKPPEEPAVEAKPAPAPQTKPPVVASGEGLDLRQRLALLLDMGGTDLHVSAGQLSRVRVNGDLRELDTLPIPTGEEVLKALDGFLSERSRRELESQLDADFAIELDDRARFRVNVYNERNGISAVFRQIPTRIPSFTELRLPPTLRKLAELPKGLVLVTGPTGSGKSTTLAAILDLINETRNDHILTIEDPIEFVHPSKRCLVNQREVGAHAESFHRAVRAALREDPDVVLVGEMRDLETISMAIETAETGHLVFGTLHTTTAASTVERVIGQFPADREAQVRTMLAGSLRAVVAQVLLKKIGGGRVAAFEVLIATPAVVNLIREGKTFQIGSAMQTGRASGMVTLTESLLSLVNEGLVTAEEAYAKAVDKVVLLEKLQAAGHEIGRAQEAAESEPAAQPEES